MPRNTPPPTNIELRLLRAMLRHGEHRLAAELGLSAAEVCRKINGQTGWSLNQIGQVLELLGMELLEPGQVGVDADEYRVLRRQAAHYLMTIREDFDDEEEEEGGYVGLARR